MMKTAGIVMLCACVFVSCGGGSEDGDILDGTDVLTMGDQTDGPATPTVIDQANGLMWQSHPAGDWVLWDDAYAYCDGLVLEGYDDWHLPTISELRTLIRGCPGTVSGGACQVQGGCAETCYTPDCEGCGVYQGSGVDGCFMDTIWGDNCDYHWSSSTFISSNPFSPATMAWYVQFDMGWVWYGFVTDGHAMARCVRLI